MIYGIGTDIIEIERIQKACQRQAFLEKHFSGRELEYFGIHRFNAQTVAGSFAAKEAFSKALGTGVRGFALRDVEVLRDVFGKPYIEFRKRELLGGKTVHLTISHARLYACATVIIEEGEHR